MLFLKQYEAILGPCKASSGTEEFQFNCPFCIKRRGKPDTKGHLYVNPTRVLYGIRGWYYCHRCEARGPLSRIVKGHEGKVVKRQITDWDKFVRGLKTARKPTSLEKKHPKVELPEDYVPVVKGTEAYTYLTQRGITDSIIADYRIGFGSRR